jgi:outer membrane protein
MLRLTIVIVFQLGGIAAQVIGASAFADVRTVDLEQSFRAALARSELVASQKELLVQQEEIYSQARGGLLPSISAFGSYLIQETPTNAVGSTISPSTQPHARITATQPLFRGFREFAGLRQARDLIEAQESAWRAAATSLYVDVATSFYSLIALEKSAANTREEMELHALRLRDLQARVRIGRSRHSEVLTVQATRASLGASLAAIEGQIQAQRALFAFLTGFEPGVIVRDAEEIPKGPLTLEAYLARIPERPDVRAEEKRLESAGEAVSIASGAHWPSLDLNGNYYLHRVGSLRDVNWDVQLVLQMPLFQGGIISSQVRQSESQRTQAELNVSRVRRTAEQEIRSAFDVFQSDLKQLEAVTEANDLARRNYAEQTKEYRLGLVTNLDVLSALAASEQTRRTLDRTKASVKLNFARLEAAGARRPGNLQKIED